MQQITVTMNFTRLDKLWHIKYWNPKWKQHYISESGTKTEKEDAWRELSKASLTHLILFKRRRQGEVAKIKTEDYDQGPVA